jgi:hypothetical protein
MQASLLSAAAAKKNGQPWVLDPVGVGVTKHRTDHCVELMKLNPTVVRGNASEIITLVGTLPASSFVNFLKLRMVPFNFSILQFLMVAVFSSSFLAGWSVWCGNSKRVGQGV